MQFYLAIEKNIKNRKKLLEEYINRPAGVYGVDLDESSLIAGGGNELVDVNSRSEDGYTPIIVAIEAKNQEILQLLIENGANLYERHPVFNRTTVGTAAYYENEEAVEMLLKKDSKLANIGSTVDGWTPLKMQH